MKIIDKTKRPDIVEFCEIEHGVCFKITDSRFDTDFFNTDDVFMRTNANMFKDNNAIRLETGTLESLPIDTECMLLDAELTVTIKK